MTTGATSDMQQATSLARRMVMVYGYSDKVGLMYETDVHKLGPETRRLVDSEIRKLLDTSFKRTMRLMSDNKKQLITLATALRDYETLSGEELKGLISGKKIQRKVGEREVLRPAGPPKNGVRDTMTADI